MPATASGSLRFRNGSWRSRVTLAGKRPELTLSTCAPNDEAKATERTQLLADLAAQLTTAGRADVALPLLARAAARDGKQLADVVEATKRLCSGDAAPVSALVTYQEFGERWTSGELHRRYPDHVKQPKSHDDNRERLRTYVFPIVGSVALRDFTIEHADAVMSALPSSLSRATRRHCAQVMSRVLTLAAFPGRIIDKNPLPKGYLPQVGPRKALAFLYPDEDAALMGATSIDLMLRLLYGLLAREGMRRSEAGRLTWSDVDLVRGAVRLDTNKTDDPRAWALDPGVVRALATYRRLFAAERPDDGLIFVDADGEPLIHDDASWLADDFREHLRAANVARAELFERSATRQPIRIHDLRATFVTTALANGQSETWVADRTGHRSSVMINRYRRAARQVAELNLGKLAPLDEAIPELRPTTASPQPDRDVGRDVGRGSKTPPRTVARGSENRPSFQSSSRGRGRTGTPFRIADFEPALRVLDHVSACGQRSVRR